MDDDSAPSSAKPLGTMVLAQARKIDHARPQNARDFTYSVLPAKSAGSAGERRSLSRQRTRLRSGKVVRRDGQFLCECLVYNRSASGCRLRLPDGVPELPETLYFYDDQSELLFQGGLIWRRGRDIGLRLSPCASTELHRSILGRMRRKFFALRR